MAKDPMTPRFVFGCATPPQKGSRRQDDSGRVPSTAVTWRLQAAVLAVWLLLMACVTAGSILPPGSPLLKVVEQWKLSDLALHFFAYVLLSALPVIGFSTKRTGVLLGLSMFLLGLLLEAGQMLTPGRAVELGDVVANGAGVCFGTILGLPLRTYLPI